MPDSFGKRRRDQVKGRKATAREERRVARNQRRAQRAAGEEPAPVGGPTEGAEHEGVKAAPREDGEPDHAAGNPGPPS